jgi:hypothetical protein
MRRDLEENVDSFALADSFQASRFEVGARPRILLWNWIQYSRRSMRMRNQEEHVRCAYSLPYVVCDSNDSMWIYMKKWRFLGMAGD